MDLVDMAVEALHGTKVGANAAKGRTYDAAGLRRLLTRLEGAIDELEGQNEAGDEPAILHLPETFQRLARS